MEPNLAIIRQRAKAFSEIYKDGLFDSRLARKIAEFYVPALCDEIIRLREIISDMSNVKIVRGKGSIKAVCGTEHQVLSFEKFNGKGKKKFDK